MSLTGTIVLVYRLCFCRASVGLPRRWKQLLLCVKQ